MNTENGRFTLTTRIFEIISDLAPERQFHLYRQLVGDKIRSELFKLILDMTEKEKAHLLMQLGSVSYDYEPPNTLNLEDDESMMRGESRKICELKVKCKLADHSFQSSITDISQFGAFIESNDRFPVGDEVLLAFKLPGCPQELRLSGHVARSGPRGFGIKFDELESDQAGIILKYIDSKK